MHGADSDYGPAAGRFGAFEHEAEAAMASSGVCNGRLMAEGYFVFACGLRAEFTATVVDGTGDNPVFTDGARRSGSKDSE